MTQNQLQSDVTSLQIAGAKSAVARIVDHGQVSTAVAGTTTQGTITPVSVDTHYRTGSITKTFVSTVVLALVGEARLSLDDTVDRWLPGLIAGNGNDGTQITVRQLLQHTSGLFNYVGDDQFLATQSTPEAFAANADHHYAPQDLITIALAHPPVFAPGSTWGYSNTNYIVLGLIIQAVTGNTWDVEVGNRIITPLGLAGTSVPGDVMTLPAPFAHGYNIYVGQPNRVYTDVTADNLTWGDAAGAIITTTADEATFFSALLGGQLLPPAQLAAMKTTVPIDQQNAYGLGIARLSICGKAVWWHSGGTFGYQTWAGTTPDGATTLVYNVATTDVLNADNTYDNNISSAEANLRKHTFCGSSFAGHGGHTPKLG